MLLYEKIKQNLDVNFIDGSEKVLQELIEDFTSIACDISNRANDEKNKEKLEPYIKKAVVSEYLQRGADGMNSRNEGSISSAYYDIVEKLRKDIIRNGLRKLL